MFFERNKNPNRFKRNSVYYDLLLNISINTVLIGVLEWTIDGIECSLFTALLFSTLSCVLSYFFNRRINNNGTE